MLKRLLVFLLCCLLLGPRALAAGEAEYPADSAGAMILIHPASGRVLAEKDADRQMLIASTTKLMTALVAVESGDLSARIEIRPEWTAVEGSSMYLRPGESYTLHELLQGLLIASGNDAALAISALTAEDTAAFVEHMNRKAASLGLTGTHFENPHGLDAEGHYSTARDLALIMAAALQNETLREILGTKSAVIHGVAYTNHNKLLWRCQGVNGGKTGYTMAAGRCLVTSCCRDGLELICVTLSDAEDWRDHQALYDWAYANYASLSLPAGSRLASVPVISGDAEALTVAVTEDIALCLDKSAEVSFQCALPPFAFAPVTPGESAGRLTVRVDGERVYEGAVVWAEGAALRPDAKKALQQWLEQLLGVYYFI